MNVLEIRTPVCTQCNFTLVKRRKKRLEVVVTFTARCHLRVEGLKPCLLNRMFKIRESVTLPGFFDRSLSFSEVHAVFLCHLNSYHRIYCMLQNTFLALFLKKGFIYF